MEPKRYTRIVTYERDGDKVTPIGQKNGGAKIVPWRVIRRQEPEPELVAQWLEHIDSQRVKCHHRGCDGLHDHVTVTRQDLISRGLLTPAFLSTKVPPTSARRRRGRRNADNQPPS